MKGLGLICLLAGALTAGAEPDTNAVNTAAVAQREFQLGETFLEANQLASAVEAFERAALLRPDFAAAHARWAAALVAMGRLAPTPPQQLEFYQQAALRVTKAAELEPREKAHFLLWGEMLTLIGDLPVDKETQEACYRGAVDKYRRAVELAPREWEAYSRWGAILAYKMPPFMADDKARLQVYKNAARLFEQAAQRTRFSSETGPVYAHWGTALARTSRYTTNVEERKKLLQESGDKFERSARARSGVATTHTLWGTALVELGKLTRLRSDFREAAAQLTTSLKLRPKDPATLYTLACAYGYLDNIPMVVQTLRDCFAADPSGDFYRAIQRDPDFQRLRGNEEFMELFRQAAPGGMPAYNPPISPR